MNGSTNASKHIINSHSKNYMEDKVVIEFESI